MRVSDEALAEVHDRGFTVVEGFLGGEDLAAAQEALWRIYPHPEDYFANPGQYADLVATQFSGLRLFPYHDWAINRLAVNPDLVDAAERFCGTDDLDLYKVELWAKYSGAVNYDQPHHRDYSNHSVVVPKVDDNFVQMTTFLLLSDVTENDGPTKAVPLDKTQNVPMYPRFMEQGAFAEDEISVTGPAGSLLIYKTDVMHRGSAMVGANRSRFTLLVDFQPRGRAWTGKMAWPDHALSNRWKSAMSKMTTRQRCLFGFPAPGDPYWDAQTLHDVSLRYPDMEMAPYRAAI
ncbi:MAG: phytanoyl-CoA dioxygenase family protein [Pseudomonadota bacterium]